MNHFNQLQSHNSPQQTTPNTPTMKPIFKRRTEWRCMKPSDISYINKYKPKMLHHVSINNLSSETLGTSGLKNLRKALKDSKTISSALFSHTIANVKQLTYLLDSTNHWNYLSFFSPESTDKMDYEFIKTVFTLGKYKRLSQMPLPYLSPEHGTREISTRICHQIKKLHKLDRLSLDLPFYNNPGILNLRLPHSLKYLNLNFKNKALIPQQQLSLFIKNLHRHCNLLEEISLYFSKNYLIEPSDAQVWASFFQNTPKLLKKLDLCLKFSADQKPEGVQIFMRSLKHLKNLISLSLTCLNQPLAYLKGFFPLIFNSLQSLTQLKALDLEFHYDKFENRDVKSFASMLQRLKNLKNLNVNLPFFPSPDQDLISFAKSLKHLNNLKALELKIANNFSKNSMQILFNNIPHLYLTSLHLDTWPLPNFELPKPLTTKQKLRKLVCFWGQKKVHPTPSFLKMGNFTQLSTLDLQLSSFELSNQELENLSLALQKFNQLSSLTLNLPQLNSENNFEGLEELLSCFKNLPKLSQLELSFKGEISKKQVKILSTHLADCQSLSSLDLQFQGADGLKDKILNSLLSGICGLLNLKYLALFFGREEAFGKMAVSNFLKDLMVIKGLSMLYFVYNMGSMFQDIKIPLPADLWGYKDLRYLERFVVGDSRYI